MPPAEEHHGAAFVCSAAGVIQRIIRDELQLPAGFRPGASIVDLVEEECAGTAAEFFSALTERGAAFDWALEVRVADRRTVLHFAGIAEADHLFVVAAGRAGALAHRNDELMHINNEQSDALRPARKALSLGERQDTVFDRHLYDDMSRLNNELANVQREMAKKNAELEKLNNQKNLFLGMAAHDLRSPLGIIYSLSNFIEEDAANLNDEQREFVTTIKKTSEFMLRLVSDLLDVAAIEAGRLTLDRQPADLAALVQRNLALNRVLAARKDIIVDFELESTIPLISIDAGKIEQVLNNLVGNALKFSHRGTRVIVRLSAADGFATIAVRDQGPGIPAADLPKLFTFFGRASVRSTAGENSTGLGLAIVRRIVEGHGGRVWVESEIGVGTTVLASLPLTPA